VPNFVVSRTGRAAAKVETGLTVWEGTVDELGDELGEAFLVAELHSGDGSRAIVVHQIPKRCGIR
jgi:NTP pyrophosphatase (non-canonical NTP hydrolase)